MEQQPIADHGVVDSGPPTDTDLTGTIVVSTSTVVSEGEWLAVSTERFSEQQRGLPLAHLVKELVQNALDSVGDAGRIDLTIRPMGSRTAWVRCTDNGPGAADLLQLNMDHGDDPGQILTHRSARKDAGQRHPRVEYLNGFPASQDPRGTASTGHQITQGFLAVEHAQHGSYERRIVVEAM